MPRNNTKPPKESPTVLKSEIKDALWVKYRGNPDMSKPVDHLLDYFSTADLVAIRDELRSEQ